MIEIEFGISSEQLFNQLCSSIEMVKKFKKLMTDALYFIKRNYDTYSYISEFIGSDYFHAVTDRVKCELVFNPRTKRVTMRSLIDKELKKSIKLLSGKEYWDFLGKEQEKEELERIIKYDRERNRK